MVFPHQDRSYPPRWGESVSQVVLVCNGSSEATRDKECKTRFAPQRKEGRIGGRLFALPNFSNLKDDLAMGSRKLTPEDLDRITLLAMSWGKIVVRQAFGDDGPGLDVDLEPREQVALAAARGLTAAALEQATTQQAQRLGNEQPDPPCGRPCAVLPHERPLPARGATFAHREPQCYCPTCRRDFFPSTPTPEGGCPRRPSGDPAPDRGDRGGDTARWDGRARTQLADAAWHRHRRAARNRLATPTRTENVKGEFGNPVLVHCFM